MESSRKWLFENLLLFDKVTFRVNGESVIVPVLFRMLGERGFDTLIDQEALSFVLWTQNVLYLQQNIKGLDALGVGTLTSAVHADPEASIEAGLRWMVNPPIGRKRRQLIHKIAQLYKVTEKNISSEAVAAVKAALKAGDLSHYGLRALPEYLDCLTDQEKQVLARTAEDFSEYKYLLKNNMTSFGQYQYFSPFWRSAERFQVLDKTSAGFASISKLHGLPDVKAVFDGLSDPLSRLPRVRSTRNARLFRSWLATTAGESLEQNFVNAYLDAIAERKGFFQTLSGKTTKSVAMAVVGAGLGSVVGGETAALTGSLLGVVAAKVANISAESVLGVFDSVLLERLLKGWSPRMFLDELAQLKS